MYRGRAVAVRGVNAGCELKVLRLGKAPPVVPLTLGRGTQLRRRECSGLLMGMFRAAENATGLSTAGCEQFCIAHNSDAAIRRARGPVCDSMA